MIPAGTEVTSPRAAGGARLLPDPRRTRDPGRRCRGLRRERAGSSSRCRSDAAARGGRSRPAAPDDALLLGFDGVAWPVSVVRIEIDGSRAGGPDLDPSAPPLVWEASGADGGWVPSTLRQRRDRWLPRRRWRDHRRRPGRGGTRYDRGPGAALAALPRDRGTAAGARAAHSRGPELAPSARRSSARRCRRSRRERREEMIGTSDGIAGIIYQLQQQAGARARARAKRSRSGSAEPRRGSHGGRSTDFRASGADDRHFPSTRQR